MRAHEGREHGLARAGGAVDDRRGDALGVGRDRRNEDDEEAVESVVGEQDLHGPPVVLRRRGGDHVDRIADARRGAEERPAALRPSSETKAGSSRPCASHASAARIPGPPALVTIPTRRPAGTGWCDKQHRDVEELLERFGADHARPGGSSASTTWSDSASAPVCDEAAREPARERPVLTATIGLLPRDAARDLREADRVSEALEVEQDHVGARILVPVLDQVVARDVGLVADGDEGRDAEVELERRTRGSRGRARRSARRGRRGPPADRSARRSRSRRNRGSVLRRPMQLGPTMRMPAARTFSSRAASRRRPSSPVSGIRR